MYVCVCVKSVWFGNEWWSEQSLMRGAFICCLTCCTCYSPKAKGRVRPPCLLHLHSRWPPGTKLCWWRSQGAIPPARPVTEAPPPCFRSTSLCLIRTVLTRSQATPQRPQCPEPVVRAYVSCKAQSRGTGVSLGLSCVLSFNTEVVCQGSGVKVGDGVGGQAPGR